jgi:hypothetical protein
LIIYGGHASSVWTSGVFKEALIPSWIENDSVSFAIWFDENSRVWNCDYFCKTKQLKTTWWCGFLNSW